MDVRLANLVMLFAIRLSNKIMVITSLSLV
jgi:hypothetical protein